MGLDGGFNVGAPVGAAGARCFCFRFFRADSLPLTSDAFGDPGRLRLLDDGDFFRALGCLPGLPDGVLEPEGFFEVFPVLDFSRSEAPPFSLLPPFFSSSLRRSAPELSDSLCFKHY